MTISINATFFAEVGLTALPEPRKLEFARFVVETLEKRVGAALTAQLTGTQLDDLMEASSQLRDDSAGLAWLQETLPRYRDVVHETFAELKAEIRTIAPDWSVPGFLDR